MTVYVEERVLSVRRGEDILWPVTGAVAQVYAHAVGPLEDGSVEGPQEIDKLPGRGVMRINFQFDPVLLEPRPSSATMIINGVAYEATEPNRFAMWWDLDENHPQVFEAGETYDIEIIIRRGGHAYRSQHVMRAGVADVGVAGFRLAWDGEQYGELTPQTFRVAGQASSIDEIVSSYILTNWTVAALVWGLYEIEGKAFWTKFERTMEIAGSLIPPPDPDPELDSMVMSFTLIADTLPWQDMGVGFVSGDAGEAEPDYFESDEIAASLYQLWWGAASEEAGVMIDGVWGVERATLSINGVVYSEIVDLFQDEYGVYIVWQAVGENVLEEGKTYSVQIVLEGDLVGELPPYEPKGDTYELTLTAQNDPEVQNSVGYEYGVFGSISPQSITVGGQQVLISMFECSYYSDGWVDFYISLDASINIKSAGITYDGAVLRLEHQDEGGYMSLQLGSDGIQRFEDGVEYQIKLHIELE